MADAVEERAGHAAPAPGARDDRVLPITRAVAALVLPFLVVASAILYVLPGSTEALFAWTIRSEITAMLLGSAYLGGIVYFAGVLVAGRWHRVWTGVPAVLVFATLAGVATLLHLEQFHAGHVSFVVWLVLYITTPVLVLLVLLRNAPRDPRVPEPGDPMVPTAARVLLAALGILAIVTGALLFAVPEVLTPVWPWPLTPLTARVVGAILTLPGLVNVLLLVDARWSAFRLIFRAQLVGLGFILVAVALHRDDLAWDRPLTPLFVAQLGVSAVLYLGLVVWMERRRRG